MKKRFSEKLGFTLVELIVVISIIAILTAIITSNFAQSRARSRDAKRISDIGSIQLALDLYFDKCNEYPKNLTNLSATCARGGKLSDYISQLPVPPQPYTDAGYTSYAYGYYIDNTTVPADYLLYIKLESNNSVLLDSFSGAVNGYYQNGAVQSANFSCSPASLHYCVKPN